MKKHLAIFNGNLAEEILNGHKTIESRFSEKKIAPFGLVEKGDLVYIKPTGKDIIGQFTVKKVIFFDGIDGDLKEIQQTYGQQILADQTFWNTHQDAKYGTLIFIGQTVRYITSPITFNKRDQRGWVVLD